jgi:glyoxylate/hydroxypyruvate/2-ketogluconate reductase
MTSKKRLLIARRIPLHNLAELENAFDVEHNQADAVWSAAELAARLANKQALFSTSGEPLNAELLGGGLQQH